MGKKLRVQRRGRGTPTFAARRMGKIAPAKYPSTDNVSGVVKDLMHEPGRGTPLAYIALDSGSGYYAVATEGMYINQPISIGAEAALKIGNVRPVGMIPVGTMISNIEFKPGDGGRVAKSSGSFAMVVTHGPKGTVIKLPSKRNVTISGNCRATIGIISSGGRREKPFLKAGEKSKMKKAKGQVYPTTKGIKMAAASHPHGGGRHRRPGSSTTVSRHAPPGAKVGLIAARNSGKRKRVRRS